MRAEYSSLWKLSDTVRFNFESIPDFVGLAWPYLLPPLFVFALEGPLSLRSWLAVQRTPLQHRENESLSDESYADCSPRRLVTYVAPTYLLAITLLGAFLQCGLMASTETMRIYDSVTLAPLFIYATYQLFALCSGMYSFRALRDSEGDPYVVRRLRSCVPKILRVVPFLAGLGVSLNAIINRDAIAQAIVHAAFLHAIAMNDTVSTKSFRSMVFYACANLATLIGLVVFFVTHPLSFNIMLRHGNRHFVSEAIEANHWPLFALTVLWNVFPVELITLCYRFDYTRAKERTELALSVLSSNANAGQRRRNGLDIEREEKQEAPLGHDMLLGRSKVSGVGPIFLGPNDRDSFYTSSYTPFKDEDDSTETGLAKPLLPYTTQDTTSSESGEEEDEGQDGTPLPTSLRLPHTRTPFPYTALTILTFLFVSLISLYLLSHVSLWCPHWFARGGSLVWYGAPLLPLVTFPIMVLAVFVARGGEAGEIWRYKEVWGAEKGEVRLEGSEGHA